MVSSFEHPGKWGWIGLGVFVATFDYLSPETMSTAFTRGLENPRSRPLVLGALALTACHLLDLIPNEVDPFHQLARAIKGEA